MFDRIMRWLGFGSAGGSPNKEWHAREYQLPLFLAAAGGLAAQLVAAYGQTGFTIGLPKLVGFYVLLTLASAFVGAALGFLFGFPKEAAAASPGGAGAQPQPAAAGAGATPAPRPTHNTNLEQVSDWLTKVLLGAGLSQLSEAPRFMLRVSTRLAGMSGQDASAGVVLCVIGAYLVIGFAIAFLWAKLRLPGFMDERDELLRARKERESALDALQKTVEAAVQEGGAPLLATGESIADWAVKDIAPGNVPDDPWKGRFGGTDKANNRVLKAEVKATPGNDEIFRILLSVQAMNGGKPLADDEPVRFFLHDTYRQTSQTDKPIVRAKNGVAHLELLGWGAFTVGVLADKGATKLELDLAQLESAPEKFRGR